MNSNKANNRIEKKSSPKGMNRRSFLGNSIVLGVAAGAMGVGCTTSIKDSKSNRNSVGGASNTTPLDMMKDFPGPMNKWKKPMPYDFIKEATANFSTANWQSGNEQSIYYNLNIPRFFNVDIAMPALEHGALERKHNFDLLNLTFKDKDGKQTAQLKDYINGPKQIQAMMMAHKGKVVFEAYSGMNPTDFHIWMSASKTASSLLTNILEAEGRFNYDDMVSKHIPELKGTIWDEISYKDTANMATGLDVEESFENLTNPNSWITNFFRSVFEGKGDDWLQLLKSAKKLKNEPAGSHMRYSSAVTMTLVLAVQNITNQTWTDVFHEKVWSKIAPKNQFMVGLTPDSVPIGAGHINTTPEDMLRYAMLYTPSWNAVAQEQVVSEAILKRTQTMGNPKAYEGCTEQGYGTAWFGEAPERNSCQWDSVFADGAMFKHGNMGQGIYVDPKRDFCGITFALAPNNGPVDHSPGYLRAAAKKLAGA